MGRFRKEGWEEQRDEGMGDGKTIGDGGWGKINWGRWTTITQLAHHGILFVPVGYTFGAGMFKMDSVRGGSPYGAGVFAGDGTRGASETELALAEHQGKYMASVVKKLAA
ncbi:probable NAD(P)H dehydrogenase (quinone) FQR1-like 2 [Pyrus x bretschneideri]|uniref:probable NAD(P)H dehydrogenase (quinone) FQR1-like 2 n=1 Tax=Pyrus x bretschneideri TaxID=225117 RepID=UPI00203009AC|nr:probable NAD(P)H dehydrogenase (quinone) FQR1-like 2 [Pyrus x bretschneideri]